MDLDYIMCGICGLIDFSGKVDKESLVEKMVDSLKHRGPDDFGLETRNSVCLGHTRLSIIDLSDAARQPMISPDGQVLVVYNGEIYNFLELRQSLEQDGIVFQSNSDTEVVLNAYLHWGIEAIPRFNGMFAFAIWDGRKEKLILARDRFGIKPLYYCPLENGIAFASEIKALLTLESLSRNVNPAALHEFMYYGVSLGDKCLYKNINKLLPGHYMVIQEKRVAIESYWQVEQVKPIHDSIQSSTKRISELMEEAVKAQLVADVPIGILLSGGIDSSCITAFASKHYSGKISTFSVGFDFIDGPNELDKARRVAKYYDTDHHEIQISGKNLVEIIPKLVKCHDEPFSDAANIPLYLICEQLAGKPKVILQGDGGDEIFAGYRRYNLLSHPFLWRALDWMGTFIDPLVKVKSNGYLRVQRLRDAMTQQDPALRMAMLLTMETLDFPPIRVFSNDWRKTVQEFDPFMRYREMNQRFSNHDLVQRMLYTDVSVVLPDVFLEKVDKSTMAHGVEVRVPMLEQNLTEYVMGLPSSYKVRKNQKKWILRQALRGIVPDDILDAPKTGFSVPYSYWLRGPLADYMKSVLLDPAVLGMNIFDRKELEHCINSHLSTKRDNGFLLWKVLNLSLWLHSCKIEI